MSAHMSAELALQDLASCVDQLLRAFYKNTRRKPSRLIFYRDGVSNGQFPEVMRSEVPQVIAACRSLGERTGEPYSPPVSGSMPPSRLVASIVFSCTLLRSVILILRGVAWSGPTDHTDRHSPACS